MIDQAIHQLVEYGIRKGLLPASERIYAQNLLLDLMKQDSLEEAQPVPEDQEIVLTDVLGTLLDAAAEKGIIEDSITYRDLFDAKLMNTLMPRPAQVADTFNKLYLESPKAATDWFYDLSTNSNYIRADRIAKDEHWTVDTPYGEIELSINLSKPEKDPKAIAAAKNAPQSTYPKCQLCMENEGYAGRVNHPGRSNHRIIPITIQNSPWGFQYSPYVYFNEHCIVFNGKHIPMAINHDAFEKLLDFVDLFPHYFLGSNADLPIVGGSILSHDHFQGGNHDFPMAKAKIRKPVTIAGFEDIDAGIVNWPMSVIRISSDDRERLVQLADHILDAWRKYTDADAVIYAETNGEPHNTITPIVRKRDGKYEMDLVLRNNLTTEEHPLGLYHPHAQWHNIKKENIGLIEVMGLAILPARLKSEFETLKTALINKEDIRSIPEIEKHADWVETFIDKVPEVTEENADAIIKEQAGIVFSHVLEDAGVYKQDEKGQAAFDRFIASL
jgi:UDPglucose--hexose-1-phosphate uridylyltransferase